MIPQSFIQELLSRVDIVDVVGRVVKLRKAGANFQGLCPFHNEKSPSFTVSPTKQFYHCFGCGAHGSAIGFLMEHHGLGYVEAIHELANGLGLTVPQEAGRGGPPSPPQSPGLLPLLEQASAYYRLRLKETPRAIDYLKRRGLTGRTAARFGIGYAPAGWRNLESAVKDYADADLVAVGLVISGEDGKRYDRFRDRIMFPIRNTRGQVIGFGGRVLDQGEPKYLNSPEGPLFSKGRELYGLFEARDAIRSAERVLVVEGYMDVVMLQQHGCGYAVATLGTATTAAHLTKLLRQADRVVFAFDGDSAGRRAAWRALENALPMLSDTKRLDFLFLPDGHDPDTYVQANGLPAFEALVDGAMPLSAFLVRELVGRTDLATPEGRARLQADLKPLVQAMPDIALRGQIVLEIASRAGVDVTELARYLGLPIAAPAGAGRDRAVHDRGGRDGPGRDRPGRDRGAWGGHADPPQPDGRAGRGERTGPGERGRWGGHAGHDGRAGQGERRGWGDRPGRAPDRGAPALRGRVAPLSIVERSLLLLAYHPALAAEPFDPAFIPPHLCGWRERVARLPPGANFAALLEGLQVDDPEAARELAAIDARHAGPIADLGIDEARAELAAALRVVRQGPVREAIAALVAGGLETDADRARYDELTVLYRRLFEGRED